MRRIFLPALLLVLMAKGGLQDGCKLCPPGFFLYSCQSCVPCPSGSYTSRRNMEKRCHPCSKDCSADFNMEVVEACSSTADMRCVCKAGYSCTRTDPKKCLLCEEDSSAQATTVNVGSTTVSTTPPTVTTRSRTYFVSKGIRKQTARELSHTSTDAPIPTGKDERMKDAVPPVSHQGVLVLMLVMSIGLLALLVVLLLSRGRGGALGLRKFMKGHFPSSNKGSMTEVTPRRPMATVQHKEIHPDSLPPAANHDHTTASSLPPGTLGPVYIQQPSTVFVSLLNQFSSGDSAAAAAAGGEGGRGGGRRGGGGGGGGGCDEEEQQADYTAPRPEEVGPTPPSPLPLSTEERSPSEEAEEVEEEISSPYQEQGKESHISKEEEY